MVEREILIREAESDDLQDITYLYTNFMFDSFVLRFGDSFIQKYLKGILNSKNCVSLVAVESCIFGFIMTTLDSKKLLSELLLNREVSFAWLKQVLRHPCVAIKSLELILYPQRIYLKDVNAEFLFIAVEPAYRKKEIGTKLIKEALCLMKQRGIKKVKVSTLAKNISVNALLDKLGFTRQKSFKLLNKYMYLYSHDLS